MWTTNGMTFRAPPCMTFRAPPCMTFRAPPCMAFRAPSCMTFRAPLCMTFRSPPCMTFRAPPSMTFRGPPCMTFRAPPCMTFRAPPCTFFNFANSLPYFCSYKITISVAILSLKCTNISTCRYYPFAYEYMIYLITDLSGDFPATVLDSFLLKFCATYSRLWAMASCFNFSPFSLVISCKA